MCILTLCSSARESAGRRTPGHFRPLTNVSLCNSALPRAVAVNRCDMSRVSVRESVCDAIVSRGAKEDKQLKNETSEKVAAVFYLYSSPSECSI